MEAPADIKLSWIFLNSSSNGDENFVENKGLLEYSKLNGSGEAIKPTSLSLSEFHFLLLIGDKVKVYTLYPIVLVANFLEIFFQDIQNITTIWKKWKWNVLTDYDNYVFVER